MLIPQGLVRGIYSLLSRSNSTAAFCYDACNNASYEAQRVGKTPALCSPDSLFRTSYESCQNCAWNNTVAATEYWGPVLLQFTNYCQLSPLVQISTQTPSTTLIPSTVDGPSPTPSSKSLVRTVISYTGNSGKTTWIFTTDYVYVSPTVSKTTTITIPETINGELRTFTFTKTFFDLPTGVDENAPSTTNTSMPLPTQSQKLAPSANRAWIAGRVIGGVVGASIIVLGSFLLWRYRRKKERPTELGSHEPPTEKTELDAPNRPQELHGVSLGGIHTDEPQELEARG
ncbi:hypothetical protein F4806DRAFT_479563 [Annulohypoxylon nitens]|nr:hypothetical protein F4806DRAFT_479563 [Annulohypoxylon nitens]